MLDNEPSSSEEVLLLRQLLEQDLGFTISSPTNPPSATTTAAVTTAAVTTAAQTQAHHEHDSRSSSSSYSSSSNQHGQQTPISMMNPSPLFPLTPIDPPPPLFSLPSHLLKWMRELDDELSTARMSLENVLDLAANPATVDFEEKIVEFETVLTHCDLFSSFRLPQHVAKCFPALPEKPMSVVRTNSRRLEDTKETLKAFLKLIHQKPTSLSNISTIRKRILASELLQATTSTADTATSTLSSAQRQHTLYDNYKLQEERYEQQYQQNLKNKASQQPSE